MNLEKKKAFIINVIFYGIIISAILMVSQFAFRFLMPFIVGFIIAFLLKPIVRKLTKRFGDQKSINVIVILLFYIVVALAIIGIFFAGVGFVNDAMVAVPTMYKDTLLPASKSVLEWSQGFLDALPESVRGGLDEVLVILSQNVKSILSNISSGLLSFLTHFISSVPQLLISILIAIISSFFFTLDYQKIVSGIMNILPERGKELVMDIKDTFKGTIGKYLVAYSKLMSLTFVELSIAFLIIGVPNPIGLAFLIAIVDILPVLGTGTVMIPWTIIQFIMGDFHMGIALGITYVFITVVRNILEPKVVGDQIGLHPLLTLVLIFVGMRLAGIVGLFGLPILVTIFKTLHDEGKIQIFRNLGQYKNNYGKKDSTTDTMTQTETKEG